MDIIKLSFDDLSALEKDSVPDNGAGKEYSSYIRVTHSDGTQELFSDAMEKEDAGFYKDLKWIVPLLKRVYEEGLQEGIGNQDSRRYRLPRDMC